MISITWLLLIGAIYSGGFVCSVGLVCEKYLCVNMQVFLLVCVAYISVHSFHMTNIFGVVGLCSCRFD